MRNFHKKLAQQKFKTCERLKWWVCSKSVKLSIWVPISGRVSLIVFSKILKSINYLLIFLIDYNLWSSLVLFLLWFIYFKNDFLKKLQTSHSINFSFPWNSFSCPKTQFKTIGQYISRQILTVLNSSGTELWV